MKPTKQTAYLPVNGEDIKRYSTHVIDCEQCEWLTDDEQYTCTHCWCEGGNGKLHFNDVFKKQEGYFFTPEQLNEYTQAVIKQALETAADKVEHEEYKFDGKQPPISKQSIKNTFEETFKNFEI